MILEKDFDISIPGYCPSEQLQFIAELAKTVSDNGRIVEIGSLFGRSANCWATASKPSIKVFCIDPWREETTTAFIGECSIRGTKVELVNSKEQFLKFVNPGNQKKITALQQMSPPDVWNHGSADIIYIDGAHDYESVKKDILFWNQHLKSSGILCGDDFLLNHPEVMRAVLDVAHELNVKVAQYFKMWIYITPENEQVVRACLKKVPKISQIN